MGTVWQAYAPETPVVSEFSDGILANSFGGASHRGAFLWRDPRQIWHCHISFLVGEIK